MWLVPTGHESNNWTVLLNGGLSYLWRYSGWQRRGRLPGLGEVTAARRERLTSNLGGAFYYFQVVGVAPSAGDAADEQRRAVVLPALQRVGGWPADFRFSYGSHICRGRSALLRLQADALGIPSFAEAVDEGGRRAFFESLGFAAVEDFTLFGVKVYHMRRNPQPVPTRAA
jgi:hypothetical protein